MDEYRERTPVEEWERDVEAEARRAGTTMVLKPPNSPYKPNRKAYLWPKAATCHGSPSMPA